MSGTMTLDKPKSLLGRVGGMSMHWFKGPPDRGSSAILDLQARHLRLCTSRRESKSRSRAAETKLYTDKLLRPATP